jgi:predicted AlkP superfamily phosphohydrolase/phosphomutase
VISNLEGYNGRTVASPKVTVIGVDAATWDVIDPMIRAGELPQLARLVAEGSSGALRSTTHPLTTQAWTTMTTGVNAGRHGMWDFSERDASGYRLRLVNGSYRRAPTIWDRLSAAGRSVGIVNVPFTWPASEVNGFLIAGIDAGERDAGMTYPQELLPELRARFGPLELDHSFPLGRDGTVDVDLVRRVCEQRVGIVRWLTERFEPDLLFVVFMAADHIHHVCWTEWERDSLQSPVADVYRILDQAVGELVDVAHKGDVLVVSDHGGGRLKGVINLNAWLAEQGFLTYTSTARRAAQPELARLLLSKALGQRRKIPKGLRTYVKRRFPRLRERAHELKEYTIIDWSRTQAFAYGTFGNIVLNMRGRESHGIVEPGTEYEHVRNEIARLALELRDPVTGERVVSAVHRREDLFEGPELHRLPDLLIEFEDYAWLGKGNLTSRTPTISDTIRIGSGSKASYVGSHRKDGIVSLTGPSAAPGTRVSANIEDIAPTLMYLLGEMIPTEFEGRLLAEAIKPDLLDARPPEYGAGEELPIGAVADYDQAAAEEVGARLRDLGYLE